MDESGQGQFRGAHSAADLFCRFVHRYRSTAIDHSDSGGKPIWAGAYDDGIVSLRLSHSALAQFSSIGNRR
jgi:hypothetical protein